MFKLRGVDRWPGTTATVVSHEYLSDAEHGDEPVFAKISFYYRDPSGSIQAGELTVDSATSLLRIHVHDDFRIKVNPNRPSSFYCGEASSIHTEFRLLFWAFGIFIGLVLLFHALRR